jgi:transposase
VAIKRPIVRTITYAIHAGRGPLHEVVGGGMHLHGKRIAAPAGLAPFARESGLQRGRRAICGSRGAARAMLFLAAQSAARWNAPLRVFYERLVGRGKPKKAPLAAVANKS